MGAYKKEGTLLRGDYEVTTSIRKKIKRMDDAHKGTLQAQGDRKNWNREETYLLYLFFCSRSVKSCT